MKKIALGLILLSALALLVFVVVYAVNGPEWDYTTVSEVFYRWDQGRFTFEYLFRQHNEHRIAAPRLVILGLGLLTRWKNPPEMYAHWALMCATAVVIYGAFRRELGDKTRAVLLFVPMMLILVSPRSYDALLGFGFPHYLSILSLVAALRILAFNDATWGAMAGAVGCGLIASFSMSNGLLVWPFGLALMLADLRLPGRAAAPWPRIVMWTVAGALTWAFYFHGYVDPGNHTSPWIFVEHPTRGFGHFLAVNGSVLAPVVEDAIIFGAVLVVFYIGMILATVADWWRRGERPPFGFWLVTIVLLSAAMISANRAGLGIRQAVSSRYTATLALGPVGLYWALVVGRRRLASALAISVATLMILGYLLAWFDAFTAAPRYASTRRWMAYMMYSAKYQPASLLEKLYANPEHARAYSSELERMRFNVFADPHIQPNQLEPSSVQPEYKVETVNGLAPGPATTIDIGSDGAVEVVGYAMNDSGKTGARAVFLTIDGTRQLPVASGLFRDTLGGTIRGRGRRWSVFRGSFGGFVLPPGEHTLAVAIVHDDGQHAFVTPVVAGIVRR